MERAWEGVHEALRAKGSDRHTIAVCRVLAIRRIAGERGERDEFELRLRELRDEQRRKTSLMALLNEHLAGVK